MKRSVYSLVLSDDIVEAIDALAYEKGTNRSNLVNQILADAVSCVTPERSRRDAYEVLESKLIDNIFIRMRSPDSAFTFRSPLRYRYNPTMNYSVILYSGENESGVFKASVRSTNPVLIAELCEFYGLWIRLERAALPCRIDAYVRDGVFYRLLLPTADSSPVTIGENLAEYVRCFDRLLKTFIGNSPTPDRERIIATEYSKYIRSGFPII